MQSGSASSNSHTDNIPNSKQELKVLVSTTAVMCTTMVSLGSRGLQFSGDHLSMADDILEEEHEGAEGFTVLSSPCVNLGRDFELLVTQSIAENKARKEHSQEIADDNCVPIEDTNATSGDHSDVTMEEVNAETEVTLAPQNIDETFEVIEKTPEIAEVNHDDEAEMVDGKNDFVSDELAEAMAVDVNMRLTDESEWPLLGCGCSKMETPKPSVGTTKQKTKKEIKSKRAKKWKPVSQVQLGFNYSVLLHKQYVDESQEYEMGAELVEFERELNDTLKEEGGKQEKTADENKPTEQVKKSKSANKRIRKCKNRLKKKASKSNILQEDLLEDLEKNIIMDTVIYTRMLAIMTFEGSHRNQVHLRRKRKWRRAKTHKASKFKQCRDFNVKAHGQEIYVSSHIHKKIGVGFIYRAFHCLPKPKYHQGYHDVKSVVSKPVYSAGAQARVNHPAPRNNYPVAKPVPRHTLNANNADTEIPDDILNVLMAIQDRDLTPEDYEILLRLDERVKPKTVEEEALSSFRTEEVTQESRQSDAEPCAICMDPYVEGQFRKFLPCGHGFHGGCIDMWLKNSSLNCPLDGLPVTEN